jgi:amidase
MMAAMGTLAIDHVITRDQHVWAFGPSMTPVLEVDPGTTVTLAMKDGLGNQITSEDHLVRDILTDLDLTHVNGATGPIAVRGAEPGDSLVVDILAIRTAPRGVSLVIPGVGQLHRHGLEAQTKLFEVDGDTIHMNERISFPLRPMLGVMGVATGGEEVLNGFAGEHGGNLDNHLHGPGARIYFPVRQPGGMFAAGDMHASMGDAEISGTGVEIAGEVDIRLGLLKGRQGTWPVTELPGHWVAHATSSGDFREAMELACEEAARLLVDQWGFSLHEAFMFQSVACDVGIAQACQPSPFSAIARVLIPKVSACPQPFAE